MSYILTSLINTHLYKGWASRCFKFIRWVPLGIIIERLFMRFGSNMKSIITEHQFFEELGFRYLGPLDGHDVVKLVHMFHKLKSLEVPTLLHVVTRKGKGYIHAEENPTLYHGVTPFEKSTGQMKINLEEKPLSELVGKTLTILAKKNKKITVITPAMKEGSGLTSFADTFPDRFFDTGISEQHATTFSAALAKGGLIPNLCIYSTFLQRGYDQLIHDIALMNLPVKIIIDRAGIVGGDGETHQGLYDIAFMNTIPNLKIFSPSSPEDLVDMISFINDQCTEHPVAIRFPKTTITNDLLNKIEVKKNFNEIKSQVVQKGSDLLIIAEGFMLKTALDTASLLKKQNLSTEVVALRTLKPLDTNTLRKSLKGKRFVFTLENHSLKGGAGSIIEGELSPELNNIGFHKFGYPDKFIEHGSISDIQKQYGLDAHSLSETIQNLLS